LRPNEGIMIGALNLCHALRLVLEIGRQCLLARGVLKAGDAVIELGFFVQT
jgi:hypothetical protein